MPAPPPDVRTIDTLQGTRFLLPSPPLLRLAGLFPLAFGLFFSGFAVFWILGAAGALRGSGGGSHQGGPGIMSILFPLFGVPFFLVGLVPVGMGFTILFGRPEFEIRGDRFRTGVRLGPLHRSKWRPTDDVERFEINRFGPSGTRSGMYVLRAHVGEDRPLNVTGSRDRAWLENLARAITARLDRGELVGDPPEIITRDRDPELEQDAAQPDVVPAGVDDPGPPPPMARVWSEESPTGPTIFVPPRGMRGKPVPTLLIFALFWLVITNVVSAGFVTGFISHPGGPPTGVIFAGIMLLLFEAIGIGLLVYALSLARRRAILDVTDEGRTLLVTRSGLRTSSQREIAAATITAIQVQNSGTAVNNRPLRQVAIKVSDADDVCLLTGAPDAELTWLAHKLRHALASPQTDQPPAAPPASTGQLANA